MEWTHVGDIGPVRDYSSVTLRLITGPANSGKARLVFETLRADGGGARDAWLVVPTVADARHYQRELALAGVVMGVRVVRFDGLIDEIVRRCGAPAPALAAPLREHILGVLANEAWRAGSGRDAPRGLGRELAAFYGELAAAGLEGSRLRGALAAAERLGVPGLVGIYERYRALLDASGRSDRELLGADALARLRGGEDGWLQAEGGAAPVCFYGFDDLTPMQLATIEALAVSGARVTVALSYEGGRQAFAARTSAVDRLRPLASEHVELTPSSQHYDRSARAALSAIERRLFETADGSACGERVAAGATVRLMEGADERAELELVGREARALIDAGVSPTEIAIVHRLPRSIGGDLEEALALYGVRCAFERPRRLAQTSLGAGFLALLRCALLEGDAEDLLRWLRTPGMLTRIELVDRLEVQVRRQGARTCEEARRLWESERWELSALDRLRAAATRQPATLVRCVERELWSLFERPRRGQARTVDDEEALDARALRAATAALGDLRELLDALGPKHRRAAAIAGPRAIVELLAGLELHPSGIAGAEEESAVAVLGPLALRARRVRALFLCGLQEGVFPAPADGPALLDEEQRRVLAERFGLPFGRPSDPLGRERYLLYACLSRPQERLYLSWHATSEDGRHVPRSLFVDDVCDLFGQSLVEETIRRGMPAAAGARAAAPADGERGEWEGIGPLRTPAVLAELSPERHVWSASSLETWISCPVRWFVERLLRPAEIDPEAEPMSAGSVAHAVLRDVVEGLRREHGSGRVTVATLPRARMLMEEALERHCGQASLSATPEVAAAGRRRLAADIGRYLDFVADGGDALFEPSLLELPFGTRGGPRPVEAGAGVAEGGEGADLDAGGVPVAGGTDARGSSAAGPVAGLTLGPLEIGAGVRVGGRIDRVDLAPEGEAIVYDYKRRERAGMGAAKWLAHANLQLPIYMRAVERLLDREVVGGFYQPIGGESLRPRGLLRDDVQLECVRTDRFEAGRFDDLVEDALTAARDAALAAGAGALEARPQSCSFGGPGCLYPTICRCER